MKIIKNTMAEPVECTCPYCESVFSYTYDEVRREEQNNIFGIRYGYRKFVVCPVCKEDIDRSMRVELKENDNE